MKITNQKDKEIVLYSANSWEPQKTEEIRRDSQLTVATLGPVPLEENELEAERIGRKKGREIRAAPRHNKANREGA